MNLATIEVPIEEAKKRLAEYQDAVRIEHRAIDQRLAAGYRALAKGLPVLKLSESITAGGWFDNGLPRIAVVRADAQRCNVRLEGWRNRGTRTLVFSDGDWADNRGALVGEHTVRVAVPKGPEQETKWRGITTVPLIPPKHRPRDRHKGGGYKPLHNYHLLWEVEEWTLIPPRDPALLKHIGGDLWAVVAVWDLTELERAVLSA